MKLNGNLTTAKQHPKMQPKPALFFALHVEAGPFIEHYNSKQIKAFANIKLYEADNAFIVITGIGAINMAAAVAWFAALYNEQTTGYFNIGTAASAHLSIGNWYHVNAINTAVERQHFYPDTMVVPNSPSKTLYSSNSIVDAETIHSISHDLIDMEGFAFASTAQKFTNSSCIQLIKYCSDNGDTQFYKNKDWQINYKLVVIEICDFIKNYTTAIVGNNNKFETDVSEIIETLKQKLHVTFSETVQLKQALHYAITKSTEAKVTEITGIKNEVLAKEKDAFFKNLISQLYHV